MTIIMIICAVIAAAGAAGLVMLARLLRRTRGALWRPGTPLPDIPADAPLRRWQRETARPAGS